MIVSILYWIAITLLIIVAIFIIIIVLIGWLLSKGFDSREDPEIIKKWKKGQSL